MNRHNHNTDKHFSYLSCINLKEVFSSEEELAKFHLYVQEEELREKLSEKNNFGDDSLLLTNGTNYNNNNYILDKEKFLNILYKITTQKLKVKDPILSKCYEWLKKNLHKESNDVLTDLKTEEVRQENRNYYYLLKWIGEYCKLKINNTDISKKRLKENFSYKIDWITINPIKEFLINAIKEESYHNDFINMSEEAINNIEDPTFDIFKLEDEVGKENTLSTVSCYIFHSMGFYSLINYNKFELFIQAITKGYNRENSYHNDLHAADVLQTCMIYIKKSQIKKTINLIDLDICALLIGTIIHDYKHPGVTNAFLINTSDKIALKYNDASVLENYHIAESFKLIKSNEDYNIFCELNPSDYKIIRKRIIDCVLSTDMVFHGKQVGFLKGKIESLSLKKGENSELLLNNLDAAAINSLQQEFLNIFIHAADISNPTKPFHVYSKWADKVMNEFWNQGDKERNLKIPISYLCDRYTVKIPDAQIGFMDFLVLPFMSLINEIFPGLSYLLDNINENKNTYKKIKEEQDQKK